VITEAPACANAEMASPHLIAPVVISAWLDTAIRAAKTGSKQTGAWRSWLTTGPPTLATSPPKDGRAIAARAKPTMRAGIEVRIGPCAAWRLAELKEDPGQLGLETLLREVAKPRRLAAITLPSELFAEASEKLVAAGRASRPLGLLAANPRAQGCPEGGRVVSSRRPRVGSWGWVEPRRGLLTPTQVANSNAPTTRSWSGQRTPCRTLPRPYHSLVQGGSARRTGLIQNFQDQRGSQRLTRLRTESSARPSSRGPSSRSASWISLPR
jgi:hypothetical protein